MVWLSKLIRWVRLMSAIIILYGQRLEPAPPDFMLYCCCQPGRWLLCCIIVLYVSFYRGKNKGDAALFFLSIHNKILSAYLHPEIYYWEYLRMNELQSVVFYIMKMVFNYHLIIGWQWLLYIKKCYAKSLLFFIFLCKFPNLR
jgi:hypothetical protein